MPTIMTAHIAHSRNTWRASQWTVIIHALAPVIGPDMSCAMTTIHNQQTSGKRISRTTRDARSWPSNSSRRVGGRSLTGGLCTPPVERREVAVVLPAVIVPRQAKHRNVALRCTGERETARHRMARVVDEQRLGHRRIDAHGTFRGHVDEGAGRDRTLVPAPLELDRRGLHTQ